MMFHAGVIEHEMEPFSGGIESVMSIRLWSSHRTRNIHSSILKSQGVKFEKKPGSRARNALVVSRHWITEGILIEFSNPGELLAPKITNDTKRCYFKKLWGRPQIMENGREALGPRLANVIKTMRNISLSIWRGPNMTTMCMHRSRSQKYNHHM
jgi:hypothetical protein